MFRDMKGKDNDPTMIEPRLLLVPTALEETAKALMDRSAVVIATALGSTSASKREPAVNVWAGAFEPVVSEWLSASTLTGYSSTAWYLLADPNDVPAIEVSYLNGNENPVVEFFGLDSEANTLGVTWRAYFDFGVDLAEYRAGVKSKGAA
jgi:phage major head subunit gpT-like protein